jgi:hypothetical protein
MTHPEYIFTAMTALVSSRGVKRRGDLYTK